MPITQGIRHIPAYAHQNDIVWEMGPLKADRHRRSPSLCTLSHCGRAYPKSTQMKICDTTKKSVTHAFDHYTFCYASTAMWSRRGSVASCQELDIPPPHEPPRHGCPYAQSFIAGSSPRRREGVRDSGC